MRMAAWLGALALAACGGGASANKVTADWLTDPNEAMQAAVQKNRPVLIAFVGLDWSAASQGIMADVFDTPAFKDFADNNLVLLRIDLARKPESEAIAQTNEKMAESVQVEGLPTVLLWDPSRNRLIGRLNGYGSNGPGPYLQEITGRLQQWQQALAQLPPAGAPISAPQLSAPIGGPGVAGVPMTTPMPSSLSVAPPGAPGSSSLPTPEQLLQQFPPPQSAAAPAPSSSTDLPLLNPNPVK